MSDQTQPLVSVVIAFFNEERFLGEAIQSVIQQDYPNWELILVDDGAADGSTRIAKEYAEKYPGKIYYTEHAGHSNKGVTTSRNHGVRQTSGPLLAFLDADDVWLPGKLTNQVSIFGQHPGLAMVAEANRYWYSWNDPKLEDTLIPVGALQTGGQIIPVPFVADRVFDPMQLMSHLYPLGNGAAPCPSGLMVAKEAFTKVGGFEESFIRENQLYEDQVFLSKIYLEHKVYISSVCNNLYRQRPESCVKWVTANGHYHKVRQHYLQWLTDYLNAREINDTALNRLVRKALMPYHRPLYHFLINEMPQKIKRRSQNLFFSFSQ